MNFIASPPPSWTSRSCRPRQAYQAAEIESRDGYARRARSSAAMRRYGSEPSPAVRATTDSSARPLEYTRGRGEVAGRELRSAEKRRGLHPREHASALFRELDGTAAVGERAGQITPQAQHLAQDCVRSVEGLECALALLGEECLQGGLSLSRAPEVCARQRPPDAAQAKCGGTPDRLPQSGNLRDRGASP